VRRFPAGQQCTDVLPGDIVLVRRGGLIPWAIRFGQRLRFHGVQRQFAWCNHACVAVTGGPDGAVAEQLARGGQMTPLAGYTAEEYAVITLAGVDANLIARWAQATVGDPYGWPTIAAAVVFCLTGLRIDLGFGSWMICSVATSEAMKVGGVTVKPVFDQLPADIASMLSVSARS
jgi:hypothetical protein